MVEEGGRGRIGESRRRRRRRRRNSGVDDKEWFYLCDVWSWERLCVMYVYFDIVIDDGWKVVKYV